MGQSLGGRGTTTKNRKLRSKDKKGNDAKKPHKSLDHNTGKTLRNVEVQWRGQIGKRGRSTGKMLTRCGATSPKQEDCRERKRVGRGRRKE